MPIKNMKTGAKGIALIKEFEGYHTKLHNGDCKAYLDKHANPKAWSPGYKGLWTIGYGCTVGVTEGLVWTEKQAHKALLKEIAKHEANVKRLINVPLDQNQFDALVSLSYNVGMGTTRTRTIIDRLNAKDYNGAAQAFLLYDKAGGKTLRGLTRRRQAEKKLFETYTPKQVVESSRKLTWLQRLRLSITTTITALFGLDWFDMLRQAKEFAADHALLIALLAAGAVWVVFKIIENMSVKDAEEGRYIPSKAEDDDDLSP